jgi:hypothetical protein
MGHSVHPAYVNRKDSRVTAQILRFPGVGPDAKKVATACR